MEEPTVMLMFLMNSTILISEIEEVVADLGQPDCKLVNPFEVKGDTLTPWMYDYSDERTIMISSDKILTLVEPKQDLLNKYKELTQ